MILNQLNYLLHLMSTSSLVYAWLPRTFSVEHQRAQKEMCQLLEHLYLTHPFSKYEAALKFVLQPLRNRLNLWFR